MLTALTSLPNIGPKTAAKLKKIGIHDKEDFMSRDPYEVFHELKVKVDPDLCTCALASIVAAQLGVPWYKVVQQSKKEYLKRYTGSEIIEDCFAGYKKRKK